MQITRGRIPCGQKVIIYGTEGIGKTTLAAHFPNPVFIDTEGSTKNFDVARFPAPTSWEMLKQEAEYPIAHPSEVGTLVIDTADWAEKLCNRCVCQRADKKGIEDFSYGKGYVFAAEEFGRLLDTLDRVTGSGTHVVITAHAILRKVEQPDEMTAYDRWELKCSKKLSPMLKEWADLVLFCNYKTIVIKTDDNADKGKAQGGKRVMYATHHTCWDAKNRHGLPDELPMEYGQIAHLFRQPEAATEVPNMGNSISTPNTGYPVSERNAPQANTPDISAAQMPTENPTHAGTNEARAVPDTAAPATVPGASTDEASPFTGESIYRGIYAPLADLLRAANATPFDLQEVIHDKGVMPTCADGGYVPVSDYPQDLCEYIISNWEKVSGYITECKNELPF